MHIKLKIILIVAQIWMSDLLDTVYKYVTKSALNIVFYHNSQAQNALSLQYMQIKNHT